MPDENASDEPETPSTTDLQPSTNPEPSTLASALALLDRLDSASPPRPPTVLAVFRLYCIQQMTITEVARACRCSVGTVCNRLKLLRAKTGLNPEKLRSSQSSPCRTRGRPKRHA